MYACMAQTEGDWNSTCTASTSMRYKFTLGHTDCQWLCMCVCIWILMYEYTDCVYARHPIVDGTFNRQCVYWHVLMTAWCLFVCPGISHWRVLSSVSICLYAYGCVMCMRACHCLLQCKAALLLNARLEIKLSAANGSLTIHHYGAGGALY